MAESIVQDWLAEYDCLQPDEMCAFVSMHESNQEIADAIYTIFNERLKYQRLIHEICQQFLSFYRCNENGLKKFPLQFIPVLIYIYLNSVATGDKKNCRSIETLLICIYNGEVSTEDGSQRIVSFRMPILAQASVYHEEKSLSMTDMRRWEENSNRDIKWGPYYQIEVISAQNRMKVMTALLFAYNQQLSLCQNTALLHLCRVASQIVIQGFPKHGHAHRTSYGTDPRNDVIIPKTLPRIPLSAQFLVELVHAIYFAMFNGFGTMAIQTLEDIHNRACYEMFTDLILVTSAVRNSLHANPSGQPSDGPMGLSVALTPATTTVTTVSKSMITNASFRTKKLPDDLDMEFLASLPHQNIIPPSHVASFDLQQQQVDINNFIANECDATTANRSSTTDGMKKVDNSLINPLRWKSWGWKYSPGSKNSSIEEEPDSPKRSSMSSSKNSSPNLSPKIRKSQQQSSSTQIKQSAEEILSNFSTSAVAAAIRRRKSPSPSSRRSPEMRASAGARLITNLEDSCDESSDEKEALLGNGRPASIHIIQTAADDIPIQADDVQIVQQQSQILSSISEEIASGEQQHHQQQSTAVSSRNSIIRSSKEGIKAQAHKALIAGFKKSKDKDKEKDKESKAAAAAAASSGGVATMKNTSNIDIPKEAPKPPTRKHEKHTQRNSLLQLQTDMMSSSDFDSTKSPASVHKISAGNFENSVELLPMQPILTNGGEFNTETELGIHLKSSSNASTISNNNNNNSILNNHHSNVNSALAAAAPMTATTTTTDSMDSNCDAFDSLHSSMSMDLPPLPEGSSKPNRSSFVASVVTTVTDEVQSSHL